MDRNFCIGCQIVSDRKTPPCVVTNIASNVSIEDLITSSRIKTTEVFVCPKGAVEITSSRLAINNSCADCLLCVLCCPHMDHSSIPFNSLPEQVLFSTNTSMHILLQSLLPDTVVASDVHVIGNSRKKRLDLVIKKQDHVFLIKLIKTIHKVQFYVRSYQEVVAIYKPLFPHCHFHIAALIENQERIPEGITNNSAYYLYDFVKYVKEI